MYEQAWIAVTAMPSQDIFLSVWVDENLISPEPPGTNRTVRRCVSPGKHPMKVQATRDTRSRSRFAAYRSISVPHEFTVELPPDSDFIIFVKSMEYPTEFGPQEITMSLPGPRDPALWPLVPENIWGYSKDRYTIIEAPNEDEEPFITEVPRIIDNPGAATVTRSIHVSQDWKRTHTIDIEGSTKVGASVKLTPFIDVQVETALSVKYGASTEETQTYTDEVSVTVPPCSKVTLSLIWKLRIRKGVVRYLDEAGFALIDVPFSVVTGVTFDQITS
jgi:hypothetical protein